MPAFAEIHTMVVGVGGHMCGWTLYCFGDLVLMNRRSSGYAISCLVLRVLGYNTVHNSLILPGLVHSWIWL